MFNVIEAQIADVKTTTFIDTGTSCSVIQKDFFFSKLSKRKHPSTKLDVVGVENVMKKSVIETKTKVNGRGH